MKSFFEDTPAWAATAAKAVSYIAAIAIAAAATGCNSGLNLPNSDNVVPDSFAILEGTVHGGYNPITGAHIQIWAVGTTGSGSAATPLLTAGAVTTGTGGSFTITAGNYIAGSIASACSVGTTQWYMTAYSGNPGNSDNDNNPDAVLTVALGGCGTLSSTTDILINEVSTAAAAYALGQFFGVKSTGDLTDNPGGDGFGTSSSSGQAYTGITNAMATAMSLSCSVSTSAVASSLTSCPDGVNGAPVTTLSITGAAGTITGTVESAQLATVANILASCVQSDPSGVGGSSACTTLLADVAYSGTAVSDTLQAAVNMSLNPTSVTASNPYPGNMAALYGLQTAQSPFTGDGAQPSDWTLGIGYTGSSPLLIDPVNIAVDGSGNIWTIDNPDNSNDYLVELSPTASPIFDTNFSTTGQTLASENPRNLAIDTNNDIWVPTSSGSSYVFEYTAGGASGALSLGSSSYGVAIDGSNDVYFSQESSSATYGFNEFVNATLQTSNQVEIPVDSSDKLQAEFVAVDTNGNVWSSSGGSGGSNTSVLEISGTPPDYGCSLPGPCTSPSVTYTQVSVGSISTPYELAAGPAGAMWVANSAGNTLTYLTGAVGSTTGTAYPTSSASNTLDKPEFIAVDGFGNIWASNKSTGGVTELSGGSIPTTTYAFGATPPGIGTALSPVKGSTSPFNVIGFRHSSLDGAEGIATDPSGNLWVANNSNSSITEIVGAAAPTVTPIASGLAGGLGGTVY